jgi:hypothetical protein
MQTISLTNSIHHSSNTTTNTALTIALLFKINPLIKAQSCIAKIMHTRTNGYISPHHSASRPKATSQHSWRTPCSISIFPAEAKRTPHSGIPWGRDFKFHTFGTRELDFEDADGWILPRIHISHHIGQNWSLPFSYEEFFLGRSRGKKSDWAEF